MNTILSLIGEQNPPNLLPIRHLRPGRVILVFSDRTQNAATRLTRLIGTAVEVSHLVVDAFDFESAYHHITTALAALPAGTLQVNVTGGTKMMSLAAYQAAADRGAPIFYLDSQGSQTRLYHYQPHNGRYALSRQESLPPLITIDDYLRAYVDTYQVVGIRGNPDDKGRIFEREIHAALQPAADELLVGVKLLGALEVDFVIRFGNQVGIIEAKTGTAFKKGIDQLNSAGGKDYLGTYTRKILVSDQQWEEKSDLRQLAEARQITVIELPGFAGSLTLPAADVARLTRAVRAKLT